MAQLPCSLRDSVLIVFKKADQALSQDEVFGLIHERYSGVAKKCTVDRFCDELANDGCIKQTPLGYVYVQLNATVVEMVRHASEPLLLEQIKFHARRRGLPNEELLEINSLCEDLCNKGVFKQINTDLGPEYALKRAS